MLKRYEDLNKEELKFVKESFVAYFKEISRQKQDLEELYERIDKCIKENDKDYNKISSKIVKLKEKGSDKDNFWTRFGIIISGICAGGSACCIDDSILPMVIFGIGTIISCIVPEIELQTRDKRIENKYLDLESIDHENKKLNGVSNKILKILNDVEETRRIIK